MKSAVVVFSGGQDSTTCLGWAMKQFDKVYTISFLYNQKHEIEIEQAKIIAKKLAVPHKIVDVSCFADVTVSPLVSNGDITGSHEQNENLPASFVPNRNALFLTLAHAYAQKLNADAIVTGVCQTDYSGYPDCRLDFIQALTFALNKGSDVNIPIQTPLMFMTKSETFDLAERTGVLDIILEDTHTCYNGDGTQNEWGRGCGECPACILRKNGYIEFKGKKNV